MLYIWLCLLFLRKSLTRTLFMLHFCGSPWWTTAYQTCMRCLMLAWEATRCRAVGSTACSQVRGPGTATSSPSPCTIRPAWSRLGPASTTLALTPVARLFLRANIATWRSLLVTATISLSTFLRSNPTSRTYSGFRAHTEKVRHSIPVVYIVSENQRCSVGKTVACRLSRFSVVK